MKATTLPRLMAVLGAAALWTLLSPGPAWSFVVTGDIVLTFTELPNEGGIAFSMTGGPGGTQVGTAPGETVTIFGGGFFRGLGTGTPHVFNLLEPDGVTISDQVIVTPGCGDCTEGDPVSVKFTSDPAEFSSATPDRSTIENGTNQFVGSYLNENRGTPQTVKIFVTSDVDAVVPSPTTLLLLGAGLTGLAGVTWRRHRRA